MIKKLTSLKRFYAVMIAFCAVFSSALKAEVFNGTCGDNLSWTLNTEDSTLVITGSGEMTSNPWSNKSANIAYLSLPEGLTSIADWAFLSCSNLKAVDIPNTVSTIGSGAFSSCFSLTSIVIPESIDEIGYNVFNSCKNLSSVVIPNSVTSIGLQAFYACYALRSVELPSSIASIGIDAFGYCPTLSLVVNSWNPPTLGSNAFYPNGFSQIYVPCERLNAYMSCDGWSAYADKMLYRPMPYTVTKTPSSYGRITVVVASTVCDTTKITAIPNGGYRFVQWEDGSTDNPRYVFLTKDITVSAEFEEDKCIVGSGTCGDNLVWELSCDSVLTISGTGEMTSSPWHAYPYSASAIKLVLIGDGVTGVRSYAFDTCANLISASIPSSVVNIGEGAFAGCKKMTHFDVHGSNPNYAAFDGVLFSKDLKTLVQYPAGNKTEHYVVDSNVERILKYAFYNNSYLYSIELPPYLREIENYAFINCGHLSSVELPSSVTNIGYGVFSSCYNLRSFTFNSTTPPTMNGDIFGGRCPRIYVPCGALDAYQTAFRPIETYVGNVTDSIQYTPTQYAVIDETQGHGYVVIKNNVCEPVTITAYPYDGYRFVRWNDDVTDNPRYLTLSQDTAFAAIFAEDICLIASGSCGDHLTWELSCDSVLTIAGTGLMTSWYINTPWYDYIKSIKEVVLPEGLTNIGGYAFSKCSNLKSLNIPNSVTSIGDRVFESCTGLTSVTIPNSVTSIGNFAFYGCTSLTSVTIPNNVTGIGMNAFSGCTGLNSVDIGSSVSSIGECAFSGCSSLTSLEIPASVTGIGIGAFRGCTGLSTITVAEGNAIFDSRNNCNAIVKTASNTLIVGCKNTEIPDNVTSIGNSAFFGCTDLTSIVIPISVTSIGYYAFSECTALTSIVIPDSVISIDNYVFENCSGLASVSIGNSVTSIGSYAFSGCSSLTSFDIPNSVTTIGSGVFNGTSIENPVFNSHLFVYLPSTYEGAYNIPDGITNIVGSAFRGCTGLTSVVIPNSVTDIAIYAFYNCTGLTSVTIPYSVANIGQNAFYNCSGLGSVTCEAINPPALNSSKGGVFSGVDKSSCILYVPAESIETYRSTSQWKDFTNILPIPCVSQMLHDTTVTCQGEKIPWIPMSIPTDIPGTYNYYDTLKNIMGCDSILHYHVIVRPSYEFLYDTTVYEGDEFRWRRWSYKPEQTGIYHYFDTLKTYFGCDSIYVLNLEVQPIPLYIINTVVNSSKYGSVEGAGTYRRDTTITLTAIPNKGYQFNQWSDGNNDNPRQVTVTQDSTFTAIFGTKICSWEVESNDLEMGAVVTTFNEPTYAYGTQITVEASPNSGFKFVKWNDGKKYNPYRFSLLDDKYLLAIFMAEEEEQDTTTVDPSSTTATFTWPFIVGGFSYSLTIYLDFACTIPLCTITFNQYGQLIGIVFGNRVPRRALAQDEGFTYTVSGLDANTEYFFKMETMDEENKLINTDEGSFTTSNETTGFEDIESDKIVVRKVMIDGQVYIVRGEEIFTLQGQIVK